MKSFKILFALMALLLASVSCTDDFDVNTEEYGECIVGEPRYFNLEFGHNNYEDITVSTRSTSDGQQEWRISNMYVLIFKGGNSPAQNTKVYGKYFDINSRRNSKAEVTSADQELWWVEMATGVPGTNGYETNNGYKVVNTVTHGAIRIKAPTGNNFKIYVIANTDAAYLQISPEILDGIQNEEEFQNYTLKLNGEPTLRTNMLMIGHIYGAKITPINQTEAKIQRANGDDVVYNETPANNHALKLKRMDAKIEVRIHINPLKGIPNVNNKIKNFIPQTWQVVNLPKSAKMIEKVAPYHHPSLNNDNYYTTRPVIFERTEPVTITEGTQSATVPNSIFSFYMLENHPDNTGKGTASTYHERDLRRKNADGTYADGDMWENAPETATYLKIVGQVEMTSQKPNEVFNQSQTLFADVVYYVHLGDFANDPNNFIVERNTRYTYNISIVDVNSIIVEVETSKDEEVIESQSGATGDVYIAKEAVKLFDAHYGLHVFRFDEKYIDDNLTWYVKTPFTPQGGHPSSTGASGLDYKWVKFFRNRIENGKYRKNARWYPGDKFTPTSGKEGDKLMFVDEFVKYIKDQKHKFDAKQPNDFRTEMIGGKEHNVIFMTVYVDEYFYEKNPISGEVDDYLWTKIVNNSGDRVLHILCDNLQSKDKESSLTNSVVTIRQCPIQTPYTQIPMQNEQGQPLTAWGCESFDESGITWDTGEGQLPFNTNGLPLTDNENGLYNTFLMSGVNTNNDWSNYFNITKNEALNTAFPASGWELPECWDNERYTSLGSLKNNIHFLRNDVGHEYRDLRYTFLLRNRDNNGDGIIDPDEIRWYVASLNQLTQLYLGGRGISAEAQIYPQKIAGMGRVNTSKGSVVDLWRQHIVSSTIMTYSDKKVTEERPKILWAEEGVSISFSKKDFDWGKGAINSIRCIRNLGTKKFSPTDVNSKPDNLIVWNKTGGTYRFDMRRINRVSLRGGGDLDPNLRSLGIYDENSPYALLPLGFEIVRTEDVSVWNNKINPRKQDYENSVRHDYPTLRHMQHYDYLKFIYENGLEQDFPGTPGERLPNIREAAIISAYCKNYLGKDRHFSVPTYYSFGFYGLQKPAEMDIGDNHLQSKSWYVGEGFISVNDQADDMLFVRDWQPQ